MKLHVVAGTTGLAMLVAFSGLAQEQTESKPPEAQQPKAEEPKAEEPEAEGTEATSTTEVKDAHRVLETRVYFEFDKAELDEQAKAALNQAAQWLSQNETSVILIEGHADKMGDEVYNKKLGAARANASRDYLVSLGVDASRIRVMSYGEALPAVETPTPEVKNRRIMVFAIDKKPIVEKQVETKVVQAPCPSPEPEVVPVRGVEPDVVEVEDDEPDAVDFGVLGGVGVTDMIDGDARALTHPGGSWNVRASFNTRYVVGVEASYVGSAQDMDDDQGLGGSRLIGNGAEGALRLNVPLGRVRPYVFGGAGWMHYNLTNSPEDSDDVLTLPAGAGVDVRFAEDYDDPGVVVDVRGTVRPVVEEEMFEERQIRTGSDDEADLDSWSVTAQAGYSF
jgi:peptidoglycan-associated lipoprotein